MSRKDTEKNIIDEEVVEDQAVDNDKPAENSDEDAVEESSEPEEPVDETAALQAENIELNERILRMAAENQNTRRRLVKQQQDAYKYRHQDILKDLAEVIDNFERAIESSADSRDFDTFHEGILMIEKQFSGMLTERYGLERIEAEGEPYNPAIHEAMMSEESSDVEVDTVKQVFQAGYRLYDRVLRPAKVVVSKPAANEIEETEETEEAGEGDE